MSLLLRLLWVLLTARGRGGIGAGDVSVLRLRVLPNDLDVNLHMNNGRYLTLMDLGRVDFMSRAGLIGPMRKNRWMPLVGAQMINFRRALAPFEAFELRSRILGWDDRWFYFEQSFVTRDDVIAARGLVRGMLRAPGAAVPPAEIMTLMGEDPASPPLDPEILALWPPRAG